MSLRALLEGEGEPRARVEAARDVGMKDPRGAIAELAAIANDGTARAAIRVLALGAAARVAALTDTPLPDLADAVGDDAVIAAALALGMPEALTGTLRQLAPGRYARIVQKLVGYRLIAAGVRGPHVSGVLIDAGELDGAARAIADDFIGSVLPGVRTPSRVAIAWGADLARHLDRFGAELAEPLRACLSRRPGAIDALDLLFEQVGAEAARARAMMSRREERN